MLIEDASLMNYIVKHMSSRICCEDIFTIVNQIKSENYNCNEIAVIRLPIVGNEKIFKLLLQNDYAHLLKYIAENIAIIPECIDVFKYFLDEKELSFVVETIEEQQKSVDIILLNGTEFAIRIPNMLCDITLPIIGQFHSEIILSFDYFIKYTEISEDMNLFLNAKSPSIISQFIQLWVSEKLNISSKPQSNILVV